MATVSLCMIVKDEEAVLRRCLASVADLVDEIIILDTGSRDETKKIAAEFTRNIYDFIWCDDFAAARNAAFSYAVMDYCMWLDADDIMLPQDREKFLELKNTLAQTVQVVMMPYHAATGKDGSATFSYYRERLIKNRAGMQWQGRVHEAVSPIGKVHYADCAITHKKEGKGDAQRNLRIFNQMIKAGEVLEPRMQFYYGRELYYHKQYEKAQEVFSAFLKEEGGWLENKIDACHHQNYCLQALGREEEAVKALLAAFLYDRPRAETCCEIGSYFFKKAKYTQAAYWYAMALTCPKNETSGAFIQADCYDFLPCIQLSVCYYYLGKKQEAKAFYQMAQKKRPNHPTVVYNRPFFEEEKE